MDRYPKGQISGAAQFSNVCNWTIIQFMSATKSEELYSDTQKAKQLLLHDFTPKWSFIRCFCWIWALICKLQDAVDQICQRMQDKACVDIRNETLIVLIVVFCFCSSLSCMDPSIAIKPVFQRFQSVVITSGVSLVFTLPLQLLIHSLCSPNKWLLTCTDKTSALI